MHYKLGHPAYIPSFISLRTFCYKQLLNSNTMNATSKQSEFIPEANPTWPLHAERYYHSQNGRPPALYTTDTKPYHVLGLQLRIYPWNILLLSVESSILTSYAILKRLLQNFRVYILYNYSKILQLKLAKFNTYLHCYILEYRFIWYLGMSRTYQMS